MAGECEGSEWERILLSRRAAVEATPRRGRGRPPQLEEFYLLQLNLPTNTNQTHRNAAVSEALLQCTIPRWFSGKSSFRWADGTQSTARVQEALLALRSPSPAQGAAL